uniref:Uncharacterized protein n=1 Tax=Anguilla anguilla TaxID=7936 RepID=A0A0E9SMZ8_ANGAN
MCTQEQKSPSGKERKPAPAIQRPNRGIFTHLRFSLHTWMSLKTARLIEV